MGKAGEVLSTDWVGPSTCSLYEEWNAAWVGTLEARVEHKRLMVTKLETKSIPLFAWIR